MILGLGGVAAAADPADLAVRRHNINEKIATNNLFFHGINTFHLDHLRASEAK